MAYNNVIDRATNPALVVPETVAQEVVQETVAKSTVMSLARTVRMPAQKFRVPVLDVLPNAYWVNGDTGLKQTTSVEWEQTFLTAEPLAVLVVVPDEFMDDSGIPIWTEVKPLIGQAFGKVIDNAAIWNVNRPTSWSQSIYTNAAAAGNFVERGQNLGMVASGTTVNPGSSYSDLGVDLAMVGKQLASDGFQLNGWAYKPGLNWDLIGARDLNGQPIFSNGTDLTTIYGYEAVEQRNGAWNNNVTAIGGDWSKAIFGVRNDITFTIHTDAIISDDSGNVVFNAMQQDSKILRVVGRFGFTVANPVTALNGTAASRSPFSVLADNNTVGS